MATPEDSDLLRELGRPAIPSNTSKAIQDYLSRLERRLIETQPLVLPKDASTTPLTGPINEPSH